MKVAIMQPYFFPYIGYFQLINAVDEFILLDEVQYIERGWINRNRILSPSIEKEFLYITVPLQKHNQTEFIKNIKISYSQNWVRTISGQLSYYKKIRAPYFPRITEEVNSVLGNNFESIVELNYSCLKMVFKYLELDVYLSVSSEHNFDYSNIKGPGEWALEISKQKKVDTYINPIGGKDLFDKKIFEENGIKLRFFKPKEISYKQSKRDFVPWLSIIDIMMFNSKEEIRNMLSEYELI